MPHSTWPSEGAPIGCSSDRMSVSHADFLSTGLLHASDELRHVASRVCAEVKFRGADTGIGVEQEGAFFEHASRERQACCDERHAFPAVRLAHRDNVGRGVGRA